MNTEWTGVEVGIILAALGIYDAEVGSSGGRCGTGPCTDVGEERFETSRAASSVVEVVMYSSNNMISRETELKPKNRGKKSIMKYRTTRITIRKDEKQGRQKKTQSRGGGHHDECFFLFSHRRERIQDLSQRLITRPF